MIVWLGLLVALVSSLVAFFSDLRYPKGVRPWSRRFLFRNRYVLVTALLALAGFIVAVLGVRAARSDAEMQQQQLRLENQRLQTLALQGKKVVASVRFAFDSGDAKVGDGAFDEQQVWEETRNQAELPAAIGFIPSRLRRSLFPKAKPEPLLRYLGDIWLQTGRHDTNLVFQVRSDGTVRDERRCKRVEVGVIDNPKASLVVEGDDTLDALGLFHSFVRAHEEKLAPVRIRVFTNSPDSRVNPSEVEQFRSRRGRVTFFLDEAKQLAVTAMIRGASIEDDDGDRIYKWEFSEPPYLDILLPGGMK
jgi:hypothetical protein